MNPNIIVAQIVTGVALVLAAGCGKDDVAAPVAPVGSPPTFTAIQQPIPDLTGVDGCSLAWGDCDNDGDLDLAVAGTPDGISPSTTVYANDGAGGFSVLGNLTGVASCSLAWGDCDSDGDLDLAVAGSNIPDGRITTVYGNDGPLPNVPPGAPTGLQHLGDLFGYEVLRCNAARDAETPAEGLSYNLMIRDASGLTHCYPAMADETTGARRVPAAGSFLWREPQVLFAVELAPGDYEARVQAIDSGFEGGAWSEPVPFAVQ